MKLQCARRSELHNRAGGINLKKSPVSVVIACLILAASVSTLNAFPLSFSVNGSIGMGYYSMSRLNATLAKVSRSEGIRIEDVKNGINVGLSGRVWLFDLAAVNVGYERFWAESSIETDELILSFKMPADVYFIGATVRAYSSPSALDICIGSNICKVKSTYGTNLYSGRILREYKGEDTGYEFFTEIHTNFLKPLEVGAQLGYRYMKVSEFKDKEGQTVEFEPGVQAQIDYSGLYFYIMAGIRI